MSSSGEDSASCPSSFKIDQQLNGDHLVLQETSASSSVVAETLFDVIFLFFVDQVVDNKLLWSVYYFQCLAYGLIHDYS